MTPTVNVEDAAQVVSRIHELDEQIIELLVTRTTLARSLPPERWEGRGGRLDVAGADRALGEYRSRLGGSGELIGRAILCLARAMQPKL